MTKTRFLMAKLSLRSFPWSRRGLTLQESTSNIQRSSKLRLAKTANKRGACSARRLHESKSTLRPRILVLGIWIFSGAWMLALGASSPPLTTAQQVLELGLEAARRAVIPVRLQGLVTYPDAGAGVIYVQDSSAGIRVAYTNANYQPASGQVVVVEGSAAG